ncbi:MAG: formyltetrahydrofolate deformylase [Planctomycetaceae bacterium]|nr:formyltetrahydrofolate deformylase [Planctomycetaceae bacterium]
MQIIITAVGPDNVRLVDPIIHYVTGEGANIAEVQMYDHDEEAVFAMLLRISLPSERFDAVRNALAEIGQLKNLSIRVWSPEERAERPRLAICTTYRQEPAVALLRAIRDGLIKAEPTVMIGNRNACRGLAEQFDVPWHMIGDEKGRVDDEELVTLFDQHEVDYVVLARYMRVLTAGACWKYAGGRIINLHHGILPSFPGIRPYHDAYANRMLTYGATCHFIVPDLDAGNQIINQATFTVPPGTPLDEVIRTGQEDNEPRCLVEAIRRVVDREVQLHFHRVVACD